MSSARPDLRLDWCSHQAAKYAVEHWHYSRRLSRFKNAYIGVWEDRRFIGVVVFGVGAGGVTDGRKYGLAPSHEMAELTRIALRDHAAPISRIVSIALRMLRQQSPGIRLVISMADPSQGHHGGIYQAGNWMYTGETSGDWLYLSRGKWVHHRTATRRGTLIGLPKRKVSRKHRYLMPLDDAMRAQIAPLARPYPKRAKHPSDAPAVQVGEGGAAPTRTLQEAAG